MTIKQILLEFILIVMRTALSGVDCSQCAPIDK